MLSEALCDTGVLAENILRAIGKIVKTNFRGLAVTFLNKNELAGQARVLRVVTTTQEDSVQISSTCVQAELSVTCV